jgi:DNA recombination protein RmuC
MQIDILTVGALGLAVTAIVAAVVAIMRVHDLRQSLDNNEAESEADKLALSAVQAKYTSALSDCTEARTRLQQADALSETLKSERDAARKAHQDAEKSRMEAERNAALANQARDEIQKRLDDWETAKAESLKHAKAAVLSTAQEVSSKLIADHKRENEAAKKESEERIRKTTENLGQHFEGIAKTVTTLHGQVQESRETLDTVWQALSSPGGAGYYAQIGLENALKSFGLERDRDFSIEHTIELASDSKRFRPDAVVFLPFESVLVIDSKASKFLLEIAELEGTEEEEAAYANLARTMNQHLRALAGKDYQGAILEEYRNSGRSDDIKRILSVMYLPNESAIERLKKADPEFDSKAAKAGIILAGPSGLSSIIGFARAEIDLGRQAANQEKIIVSTQSLLESVGVVLGHVDSVGKGLKTAATSFVKLTGSINQRLIPRSRGLMELGVRPAKNRSLPQQIPQYQIVEVSQPAVIEGDAAEIPDDGAVPQEILADHSHAAE